MKRFMKRIMAALAVIAIVILIKDEFSSRLLKDANYGMPSLIEKGYVDNLYMGSSMFRQGIDIMTLEDHGGENYVLAYNGNQPALEYFQLRNMINGGVTVRNLYVDLYVYSAWSEPKISDEKMLMEYGLKDKWSQWRLLADNDHTERASLFWQMFVTSNNELLLTWPLSSRAVNGIFHKGGSISRPAASSQDELDNMGVPQISGEMNNVQKEYLDKLIGLAKASNINITFIETPKYCKMAENEAYIEAMRQYVDFLDKEDVGYVLCDTTWQLTEAEKCLEHYAFDNDKSEYYVDNGHLSYEGRVEFTRQILTDNGESVLDTNR